MFSVEEYERHLAILAEDPDRRRVREAVAASVRSTPVTMIYGCFGSGKSTIAHEVLSAAFRDYKRMTWYLRMDVPDAIAELDAVLREEGAPACLDESTLPLLRAHQNPSHVSALRDTLLRACEGRHLLMISHLTLYGDGAERTLEMLAGLEEQRVLNVVPIPLYTDELVSRLARAVDLPDEHVRELVPFIAGAPRAVRDVLPGSQDHAYYLENGLRVPLRTMPLLYATHDALRHPVVRAHAVEGAPLEPSFAERLELLGVTLHGKLRSPILPETFAVVEALMEQRYSDGQPYADALDAKLRSERFFWDW